MATNITAGSAQDNLNYDDGWEPSSNGTMSTTTASTKACFSNMMEMYEIYFLGTFGRSGGVYWCNDFSDNPIEYHTSLVETDDYEGVLCYWSYSPGETGLEWCVIEGPMGGTTLSLTRYVYYTTAKSVVALPDADLNTGTVVKPTASPSIYTPPVVTTNDDVTISAAPTKTSSVTATNSSSATTSAATSSDTGNASSTAQTSSAASSATSNPSNTVSASSRSSSSSIASAVSSSASSSSSSPTTDGMSSGTFYALIAIGVIGIFIAGGFMVWYCFKPVPARDDEGESVALNLAHRERGRRAFLRSEKASTRKALVDRAGAVGRSRARMDYPSSSEGSDSEGESDGEKRPRSRLR